jgi:riboflavin biosynthesis pyrimidine reductase
MGIKSTLDEVFAIETKSRVHVTLTYAQSLDGRIAGKNGHQLRLSGDESMLLTHWMRTRHDAILVGIGTALNDNPQLNGKSFYPIISADITPLKHNPSTSLTSSSRWSSTSITTSDHSRF